MTEPDENENLANQVEAECYTETSGASPDAPEETVVVPTNDADTIAKLLADSNAAADDIPFTTANTPLPAVVKKAYTLEIAPDITAAEAAQLALFCFAQVLAQNLEVGITVNGMKFENFARHFKEMV